VAVTINDPITVTVKIKIPAGNKEVVGAYEFTLKYDPDIVQLDHYEHPKKDEFLRFDEPPRTAEGSITFKASSENGAEGLKKEGALAVVVLRPRQLGRSSLLLDTVSITTTAGIRVTPHVMHGEVVVEGVIKEIWTDVKEILRQLRIADIVALIFAVVEILELVSFCNSEVAASRLGMKEEMLKERYPQFHEKSVFNGFEVFVLWLDTVIRGTPKKKGGGSNDQVRKLTEE
jgi:hypothetical protein